MLLAPVFADAIMDGRQPEGMTLPGLMEGVEMEWVRQGHCYGAAIALAYDNQNPLL